jgi:DNA gyrase subunit A
MVGIKEVVESDDIVIVTSRGIIIRQHASDIRVAGRNTQGVRLIRLDEGDSISDIAAVMAEDSEPAREADKARQRVESEVKSDDGSGAAVVTRADKTGASATRHRDQGRKRR